MSGTRTVSNIATSSFDIYDINSQYLENGQTNSFLSVLDHDMPEKIFLKNDGTSYSWDIPSSMTRTFLMEGSTCTTTEAALQIFDQDSNLITSTTEPFKYDGNVLTFETTSTDYDGRLFFGSIGVTFVVTEDP